MSRRTLSALVVIDRQCNVLSLTAPEINADALSQPMNARGEIRDDLHGIVRELVAQCERSSDRYAVAFIDDGHFAQVMMLEGPSGRSYALSIERFRNRDSIGRAARRYALTKRETQVLAFILEGANTPEVASAMHIAETTVQGYYKRLLSKTFSRNRPSMVAAVCDWER